MKDLLHFRERFDGTAYYYLKYRGQYSSELIKTIAGICGLDGKGRLLDLGCGTGKLTFPMANYFEEAVGIDISSDMLQSAQSQTELLNAKKMKWVRMASENLDPSLGPFRLITSGDAFHWMDRETVLQLCYDRLAEGGAIALVGQGHMLGDRSLPWQKAVQCVIDRYFGHSTDGNFGAPHEVLIRQSSFQSMTTGKIHSVRKRDIQSIIGYLYSTSTCNKAQLAGRSLQFERELHDTLQSVDAAGIFEEPVTDYYIIAFKK